MAGVNAKQLVDGIQLTVGDSEPSIVTETKDGNWLAKLNPGADKPLKLDAYFSVPDDEVYQFQFEGNSVSALSVDGRADLAVDSDRRRRRGVDHGARPFAERTPSLHIDGHDGTPPALRVRFGGRGCTSLDGKRFQHVE